MSINQLYQLSNYMQWFGSFFILFLVLNRFRSSTSEIRILGFVAAISFLCQLLQELSGRFWGNMYLNQIADFYVFTETILLLSLYYVIFTNKYVRIFLISSAGVCLVIYSFLFAESNYHWYSILTSTQSILMILCSVGFFFQLINGMLEDNILRLPMFWINSAILFHFCCVFILSLTVSYLVDVLKDNLTTYWAFHNFLRTLFCLLISIGIWKARRQSMAMSKNTN